MRRDEAFYPFINVKTVWDMSREGETYGLSDEHEESKLKRKKEEMARENGGQQGGTFIRLEQY